MSAFGIPPPQAMPNIQTYDDDDILMDYEDDFPASAPAHANGNVDAMMVDIEPPSTVAATTAPIPGDDDMVPERVHLRGVDNVSAHSFSFPVPQLTRDLLAAQHKSSESLRRRTLPDPCRTDRMD